MYEMNDTMARFHYYLDESQKFFGKVITSQFATTVRPLASQHEGISLIMTKQFDKLIMLLIKQNWSLLTSWNVAPVVQFFETAQSIA